MSICSLHELSETITKVANRALELALENTSTGAWTISHDDVSDLISEEDYLLYFYFISDEIISREECLDLDDANHELNINCGLAWCKNIQLVDGEDLAFGYRAFRPAPSMAHLSEIGKAAVNHIVQTPDSSKLAAGDFGITEADVSYSRFLLNPETFLTKEFASLQGISVPESPTVLDYIEILCRSAQLSKSGISPLIDWCFNKFGQDVMPGHHNKDYSAPIRKMKEIISSEKQSNKLDRAGAIVFRKPAIIYSHLFDASSLLSEGIEDRNVLHAQTKMMAAQLSEALSPYKANISAAIDTVYYGPDQIYNELVAIVSAEADKEYYESFERAFAHLLDHMPLSTDITWVNQQYETALQYIRTELKNPINDPQFIEDNAEQIVIEACCLLGAHLGQLQTDFDDALLSHDKTALSLLMSKCDFAQDKDLLEELTDAARATVKLDLQEYVHLYTDPPRKRKDILDGQLFLISKGDLKRLLLEYGYDKDYPLTAFLSTYTHDLAKDIKQALDAKKQKSYKPMLDTVIKDAEKKNGKPALSPAKKKGTKDKEFLTGDDLYL